MEDTFDVLLNLEDLCRSRNLNRLPQEGELSFRMRMRSIPVLPYNFGCRIRQAGIFFPHWLTKLHLPPQKLVNPAF
uniref:Uncharacterized protein n=1 Tax=Thermocrinis ruber TaxID=75906 RepID=A0A7C5WZD5_9AQUI